MRECNELFYRKTYEKNLGLGKCCSGSVPLIENKTNNYLSSALTTVFSIMKRVFVDGFLVIWSITILFNSFF